MSRVFENFKAAQIKKFFGPGSSPIEANKLKKSDPQLYSEMKIQACEKEILSQGSLYTHAERLEFNHRRLVAAEKASGYVPPYSDDEKEWVSSESAAKTNAPPAAAPALAPVTPPAPPVDDAPQNPPMRSRIFEPDNTGVIRKVA